MSVRSPPPLVSCKKCKSNIGDDITGLCSSCDPTAFLKRVATPPPTASKKESPDLKKTEPPKTNDNGLKKVSPIIYREMPETIPDPEPTITITRGLLASDKECVDVPLSEVEAYLTKHTNCYERTLPTDRNPSLLNRAYVDLDGYAGEMDEAEFEDLCENIRGSLTFGIAYPMAMMEASQYGYEKDGLINKLSFRVQFIKKHGSKNAIKDFVLKEMLPLITTILEDHIKVVLDKECEGMSQYLSVDTGVYNPKGRKMRLWNSSKDYENRPNKLVGDATLEDTLITYIPSDSVALPEPVEEVVVPKVKKEKAPTPSETSSTNTDPKNEIVMEKSADIEILTKVIMGLDKKRYSNYDEFIKVGFICFNEGLPLKVWEDWAKQSSKNKKGDCAKHWAGFSKGKLTQATLWKWL